MRSANPLDDAVLIKRSKRPGLDVTLDSVNGQYGARPHLRALALAQERIAGAFQSRIRATMTVFQRSAYDSAGDQVHGRALISSGGNGVNNGKRKAFGKQSLNLGHIAGGGGGGGGVGGIHDSPLQKVKK